VKGTVKMKFTVFTPTFNRKNLLEKLYKSLQNQTFKDFEWLIVDDGSTDGTAEKAIQKMAENREHIILPFRKQRESCLYALILMTNI